jgi:hypothetical protein
MITIKTNFDGIIRELKTQQRQIRFATAKALTRTAMDARRAVMDQLPKTFDRPVPFTMRAIGYRPATKVTLTAAVFVRDRQSEYLAKHVTGGTRKPKGRALLIPADVPRDAHGNVSRPWLRRLRSRKDVFSGTVKGVGGLWQRTKDGRLKLLLAFEPQAKYEKRFNYEKIVRQTVDKRFAHHFRSALADAMRTAK